MIKVLQNALKFEQFGAAEKGGPEKANDIIGGLVRKLRGMGLWNLLWISLALSELFTLFMNTIMSLIVWGEISPELLKIGAVDALVVSVAVTIILILIFREFNRSERAAYVAMAAEKAKTEGVVAAVGDALCLVDRAFTVRIQNAAHRELVGNAVGKSCYSSLLGVDKVCGACPAVRAMNNGRTYQSESAMEVNGQRRVFIQKASPLKGGSGEILGAVETLHDITALRETQEKLQASTNAYRILFDGNPLAMLVFEPETFKILAVNTAAVVQYGYSKEEFLHMRVADLLEPGAARGAGIFLEDAPSGLLQGQGGLRHMKKDGSVIDVEVASHSVPFFGGTARLVLVNNITDRKQAEQKILQSEARYRGLFEESPVPLLEMDFSSVREFLDTLPKLGIDDLKDHFSHNNEALHHYADMAGILGINRAAKDLLHIEQTSQVISGLGDVFPEDAVEIFSDALMALAEGLQSCSVEKCIHTRGGKEVHVIFGQLVPPGFETSLQRVLWALTDITERKRLEEALNLSLDAKDTLIQEIHHRAKNNLAIISSLLGLQQNTFADDHTREVFKESQNRVKAMSLIHEQLYRTESLKDLNFAQYLRSLVKQLFNNYWESTRGVKLLLELENITLDVDMLIPCSLVVNELVSNALKYAFTGRKSGELYIGLDRTGEGSCRIVVRDDGPGLGKDFSIENANTMGMVIVSSLIGQIGASLDIHGEHGAEFVITFQEKKY